MIPINPIIVALAIALGISVLGNAYLGNSYLDVRDERATAQGERDQARSAATTCSEATERMESRAAARAASAVLAIADARKSALARQGRAQHILSTPATVPGNDCKSADDRARRWITGRTQP